MTAFSDLPDELKLKILSYVSFDETAKLRVTSREFNLICMDALNIGFCQVEIVHVAVQKGIRSKLPRRESERRDHALCRHADILSAIETRLSLLQITYAKYIESGYTCFIPGKVLDELFRLLRYVKVKQNPPRSHEVLMELRDISSMAMEHFEENILPPITKRLETEGVAVLPGGLSISVDRSDPRSPKRRSLFLKRTSDFTIPGPQCKKRRFLSHSTEQILPSTSDLGSPDPLVQRIAESERIIALQDEKIAEQSRLLEDMNRRLTDYNHRFNDLADVLRSHYESSLLQDKISALIQPVRSVPTTPAVEISPPSTSSASYTSVLSRPERRYGRLNTKTTEQRAKKLKDDIDVFRDECKL